MEQKKWCRLFNVTAKPKVSGEKWLGLLFYAMEFSAGGNLSGVVCA
jgi:hypothetical protein